MDTLRKLSLIGLDNCTIKCKEFQMEIAEAISRSIFDDFTDIKNRYKLGDEKFKLGLEFCTRLSTGESRTKVWTDIFGEDGNPTRDSGKFMKISWVEDILHRLYVSNHFQHVDTRVQVLNRMSTIALDESASHKASIDAAKVFLDSTAMPDKLADDIVIDISDEAKEAMGAFINAMSLISRGKAPMLGRSGEFIEIEVVH